MVRGMKRAGLALLVSLASIVPAAVAQGQIASRCDVFDWNGEPSFLKYSTGGLSGPRRVSAATTCGREASLDGDAVFCPLSARGRFPSYFWTNVSTVTSTSTFNNYWHNLVYTAILPTLNGASWNYTSDGVITTTQPLPGGMSAYLNFTQLYSCYVGTLRNCTGDTVQNGTILEGCSPVYRSNIAIPNASAPNGLDTPPSLEGLFAVVNISQAMVDQFQDTPIPRLVGSVNGVATIESHAIVFLGVILIVSTLSLLL